MLQIDATAFWVVLTFDIIQLFPGSGKSRRQNFTPAYHASHFENPKVAVADSMNVRETL